MSESGRPAVFVHLLPTLIPAGAFRGATVVVVDVLRATTVMVHALAAGCKAIIPCGEVEEARAIAAGLPDGSALLAGERQGLPIAGFDLGNSPGAYTPEVCRGKTLVMTTTNGTRAILASLEADHVFVAAFPNLLATAHAVNEDPREVHVVCSGTDGWISLEDAILAGALACDVAITRRPETLNRAFGNDEAEIVSRLWGHVPLGADPTDTDLADTLALGRGGRRVREIGLAADIHDASRIDRFPLVAELRRDPLRVVRNGD